MIFVLLLQYVLRKSKEGLCLLTTKYYFLLSQLLVLLGCLVAKKIFFDSDSAQIFWEQYNCRHNFSQQQLNTQVFDRQIVIKKLCDAKMQWFQATANSCECCTFPTVHTGLGFVVYWGEVFVVYNRRRHVSQRNLTTIISFVKNCSSSNNFLASSSNSFWPKSSSNANMNEHTSKKQYTQRWWCCCKYAELF